MRGAETWCLQWLRIFRLAHKCNSSNNHHHHKPNMICILQETHPHYYWKTHKLLRNSTHHQLVVVALALIKAAKVWSTRKIWWYGTALIMNSKKWFLQQRQVVNRKSLWRMLHRKSWWVEAEDSPASIRRELLKSFSVSNSSCICYIQQWDLTSRALRWWWRGSMARRLCSERSIHQWQWLSLGMPSSPKKTWL